MSAPDPGTKGVGNQPLDSSLGSGVGNEGEGLDDLEEVAEDVAALLWGRPSEADDHEVACRVAQGELGAVPVHRKAPRAVAREPPVRSVLPFRGRRRRPRVIHPTFGQESYAVPDSVSQIQETEAGEVARRRKDERRADEGARCIEPRLRRSHTETIEQLALQERERFLGSAADVELDTAGRVLITPELRAAASLERDVMLLGMGSHFEVWDAATYTAKEQAAMAQGMPDALKNFSF